MKIRFELGNKMPRISCAMFPEGGNSGVRAAADAGAAVAALALATIALVLGAGSGGVLTRLIQPGWATLVLAGSGVAALTSAVMGPVSSLPSACARGR